MPCSANHIANASNDIDPNLENAFEIADLPVSPKSASGVSTKTQRQSKKKLSAEDYEKQKSHVVFQKNTLSATSTPNMPRHMQLQQQHDVLNKRLSTDGFINGVSECDPRCWIVAAGVLEKVCVYGLHNQRT